MTPGFAILLSVKNIAKVYAGQQQQHQQLTKIDNVIVDDWNDDFQRAIRTKEQISSVPSTASSNNNNNNNNSQTAQQ